MLQCRYLPAALASADERASMLAEAVKSYERLGDRKSLQDCRALMTLLSSGSGAVTAGGSGGSGGGALLSNPIPVC